MQATPWWKNPTFVFLSLSLRSASNRYSPPFKEKVRNNFVDEHFFSPFLENNLF